MVRTAGFQPANEGFNSLSRLHCAKRSRCRTVEVVSRSSAGVSSSTASCVECRTFCLVCSPFGRHNTKAILTPLSAVGGEGICHTCDRRFLFKRSAGHKRKKCNTCVQRARRHYIRSVIAEVVGKECWLCGYSRTPSALHCHHIDPASKSFELGQGWLRSELAVRQEASKCALLCGNCHSEVHDGLLSCPTTRPLRLAA